MYLKEIYILLVVAILSGGRDCRTQLWKETTLAKFALSWFSGFRKEDIQM